MTNVKDIAWLAGVLEGEGSFLFTASPCITVQMSDKDIIERIAVFFQRPITGPYQPKGKPSYKQTWAVRVFSSRAVGLMMSIYSFMGERRKEKIAEVIKKWLSMPGFPKAGRGSRFGAQCHPERKRVAYGMCYPCYRANARAKLKVPNGT